MHLAMIWGIFFEAKKGSRYKSESLAFMACMPLAARFSFRERRRGAQAIFKSGKSEFTHEEPDATKVGSNDHVSFLLGGGPEC